MSGGLEEVFGRQAVEQSLVDRDWMRLVRVRGGNWRRFVVLCESVVTAREHWWKERTIVCVGCGCPACGKVAQRCVAYLAVAADRAEQLSVREVLALPIGAAAVFSRQVEGVFGSADSLVGVRFSARREGGSMRGLVEVQVHPAAERANVAVGVSREEILRTLCKVWCVPCLEEQGDVGEWRRVVLSRLNSEEFYR